MEKDIKAHIITRLNIESRVFIPRMFPINEGKCSFMIKQRQIPLRSGYIITINKSQRKSMKIDGVFLKKTSFHIWQIICCWFKSKLKKWIKIITWDHRKKPFKYQNIIYKNVLSALTPSLFFQMLCLIEYVVSYFSPRAFNFLHYW